MPQDPAAVPARRPAPIRVPDQVQQARRPAAQRPNAPGTEPAAGQEPAPGGILDELKTERAHD